NADAVLKYRQEKLHGQMPTKAISKIEFGEYKRGQPIGLTITLRNGQKLEAQSEHRNFLMLNGKTDRGAITIKHPDPVSAPLRLSSKKPDRKKDLTIRFL